MTLTDQFIESENHHSCIICFSALR